MDGSLGNSIVFGKEPGLCVTHEQSSEMQSANFSQYMQHIRHTNNNVSTALRLQPL